MMVKQGSWPDSGTLHPNNVIQTHRNIFNILVPGLLSLVPYIWPEESGGGLNGACNFLTPFGASFECTE